MTWLHQCRLPGRFRVWVRRPKPGARWRCRCSAEYIYQRHLHPHDGYQTWQWDAPSEPEQPQGERLSETYSATERAYDESEPVQIGFRMEAR